MIWFFVPICVVLVALCVLVWRLFVTFQKFEGRVIRGMDSLREQWDFKVKELDGVMGGLAGRGWDKRFKLCKEMFARRAMKG